MEITSNIEEIKNQIQEIQDKNSTKQRKTMSVPEMRRLLGLKKTESYWLVHKNFFKTVIVNGHMRVDLESFEKWYANQVKHKKINGEEPGIELKEKSYSFREAANLLGIYEAELYMIWKENNLETFTVDYVKRIFKDVFENWYLNQDRYHKINHVPTKEELEIDYILLQEAAEILNITNEKLARLPGDKKYGRNLEVIVIDNRKYISKKRLRLFLNVQDEYHVIRDEQEQAVNHYTLETKEYISREETAILAGVTKSTITKWMQAERFTCVGAGKVLRIRKDSFLQWINKKSEGGK